MSDVKLFRIGQNSVSEIVGSSATLERSLQKVIEENLEAFFGVRFLASEYQTGKNHGGRMDTLGIDENGYPVIVEYKRASNENIVNQGLFYLDWLMDHKRDFEWLVMEKLGRDIALEVEWSSPRLLCIAGSFTKYDEHAIKQMNRNIELIRYQRYGDDLLMLDLVNAVSTSSSTEATLDADKRDKGRKQKTVLEYLEQSNQGQRDRFDALKAFALALGDDVQIKTLQNYFAFTRLHNFVCVDVRSEEIKIYLKIDPDTVKCIDGFSRDVRKIGHFGTGDLELTIANDENLEKAKEYIIRSYELS